MDKTLNALKLADEALKSCEAGNWSMTYDELAVEEALAAIREALAEPVCKRCNGTKLVSDGEIDNIGGVDLEVPIECVKDCPDCAEPVEQEPVAWVGEFAEPTESLPVGTELYATPVDAKAIRAEALEEAAEWCDRLANNGSLDAEDCAAAIRGLK